MKTTYEYKDVWVANNDEAIKKRIKWLTQRGWQLVYTRIMSSASHHIHIRVRRVKS